MPGAIVTQFINLIEARRVPDALMLLSAECEYDNVPIGKVTGPEQVGAILGPFVGRYDEVDWVVHHQVASGTADEGVVMNERTDRFRSGDRWVELPVMGLFLVRQGKIDLWRDYFDLATLQRASQPA
ncbi:MAG: nuclear transport factor 2 family protein [Acidimicrobiaceae bacterium]|nr:nuclear transport factor 2 family protein [Ilumatobacter sp.]MCB9379121.1 nuclear transport factor 2 family protein [Acidimicrobiaceae bacterium]MCO5331931.1 nuclear transport factor 2 family protein [Ilumatobacteraceae bacterium]